MTPYSTAVTRKSASNLALAFVLLPKPKREAMSAPLRLLPRSGRSWPTTIPNLCPPAAPASPQWREEIRLACDGAIPSFPVLRELQPVIARYRLPFSSFDELIRGVEMDLDINRYQTFQDLEQYCYRVASVVGLLSVEIFGYQDPACRDYAIHLGKALQLTNILRDVRTDALRGRIYLPQSELQRHGVTSDEILGLQYSDRFAAWPPPSPPKPRNTTPSPARPCPPPIAAP